ncbi:reverse transcriptase domain-containing protein [Tanacetum coccineum]
MPVNVKTYDGTGDLDDHLKIFQAATKIERWAMPTWCHMFNSTLIGSARVWFDKLPPESIDNYEMLRKTFLVNYSQQKKYIKDPVEIHHIKQREGESTETFMERFKAESMHVNRAPEFMRISGFMHSITNPDLIKKLNDNIPKDKGHSTNECIHLRRQIEEAVKSGQLSHLVKEIKQGGKRGEQVKAAKKREAPNKEKATSIFMIQPWQRITRQKTTQSFSTDQEISFSTLGDNSGQETPIVIEAEIEGHLIHRMYVDGGSASEVLYEYCFNRLHPKIKNQMIPATTLLLGFNGEISSPLRQILLMVTLGDEEHSTSALMNFMVVRSPSPYNGIIGRPGLRKIQAVPSTAHGMLKFQVEGGIVTIHSSTIMPAECRMVTEAHDALLPREPAAGKGIKVAIHLEYPKQSVTIGGSLSEKGRMELCNLLKENLDIFAWKLADMTDVPRSIAERRLNVREGCQPIRQKRRGKAPDRNKAIQEEVTKLVKAEIIREVHYHDWLSNPVMVKKHDGSWRMCVDFTDLNKSCPKDCYPLPEIDWKVESLCGHTEQEILRDVEETFHNLRRINMKLNPKKCTFGAEEGSFLGHVVSMQGIKACPEKTKVVMKLQSPQTLKEAQSLIGKLASLNRFLSKSAEKSPPFFKTLKRCIKKSDFQWTTEAEKAFQNMKKCIAEMPMVTAPKPKEELIMYLCAAREALNGKAGFSVGALHKEAEKILPSTPGGAFDITYRPRTSIRGQILADLIAEKPDEEGPLMEVQAEEAIPEPWTLFTDGSSCLERSGAGLILMSPEGEEFTYALRFEFDASNNKAKYEALVAGLRIAEQIGVKKPNSQSGFPPRSKSNQWIKYTKDRVACTPAQDPWWQKQSGLDITGRQCTKMHGTSSGNVKTAKPTDQSLGIYKWGIDISGPFPEGQRKVKFLIVAIDYFTKWIEAKPIQTSGGNHIRQRKAIQRQPIQGLVREAEYQAKVKEVSQMLWAHRTMIKTSNGDTPFSLTYGTEAVIPVEIGMSSIRCAEVNQAKNDEGPLLNLKKQGKRHHTSFRPGDFVYRNNEASHAKESEKLGPKWEGPYEVVEALGKGAYRLRNGSRDILPRT